MADYHFSVTQIKRSAGQSAIAAAAYRAGEKLHSDYYGEDSDYTRKLGIVETGILLPSFASKEYGIRESRTLPDVQNVETLWFEDAFPHFVST